MKTQHTPIPWKWDGKDLWHAGISYDSKSDPHLYTGVTLDSRLLQSKTLQSNAEFIVRACNSHEELLEALKSLLEYADAIRVKGCGDNLECKFARAAIAKATEKVS